jgi:hypothetical protein
MSRVVSALVTRDRREMRREHVDDLAFPFVAPLRAKDGNICLRHSGISYSTIVERQRPLPGAVLDREQIGDMNSVIDRTMPKGRTADMRRRGDSSFMSAPRLSACAVFVTVVVVAEPGIGAGAADIGCR